MTNLLKNSKPRANAADYLPALRKYVFQNQPLRRLRGSLFHVGGMIVEVHVSKPDTVDYFFGSAIDPRAHMILFVCCKEEIVVCLEPSFLRALPLSKSSDGKRVVFTIKAEDPLYGGETRLVYKKGDSEGENSISVTQWCVPLYEEPEW